MHYYVLFNNHTESMAMYRALKDKGFSARISPTPRELSVCCVVSLLIEEEDVENIKAFAADSKLSYISIQGLDNKFDNTRHRYG